MDYRPDNWEKIVFDIIEAFKKQGTIDLTRRALIEAGADAMLEVLFRLAKESPTGRFTFEGRVINVYGG